jgi:hypothetical protein
MSGFDIPGSFWQQLTEQEFGVICETGKLNEEQCRKLWRHMGRLGEPPVEIGIAVNRDDVLKLWPETKQ